MASVTGKSLLVTFWLAFFVAGISIALPEPISTAIGSVGQVALAVIWMGYPILLFCYFAERAARVVGVLMLVCSALVGYVLSVLVYDKSGGLMRGTIAPLVGAALIVVPFVAGASALKQGEKAAKMESRVGVIATAAALFALPFFGAYVHERFRRLFANHDQQEVHAG